MDDHYRKIRNILITVLVLNWSVALAKIIYGLMSRCASMSADGFHSFSDGASNIIGLIGISLASQPIDKDHPYGHKKYETFAAIIIAILLFIISFEILKGGIARLINPVVPSITPISFVIMLSTISVNSFVFLYERKKSRALKSDVLLADAYHTRSDILISISVICTLIAVALGFPILDAIVSMVIALFIAHSAIEILRKSSDVLCDREVGVSDKIRHIALSIEGVKSCHKIRTRGRQDDIYADLHVQVDPAMSVGKAHELSHVIVVAVKDKIDDVTDITVHIEPGVNR